MERTPSKQLVMEVCRAVREIQPNIAFTFNFNPPRSRNPSSNAQLMGNWELSPENAKKKITDFFNICQSRVFGRGWYRNAHRPWPKAYGFLENRETNFHYHLAANWCPQLEAHLVNHGVQLWREMCPGGELHNIGVYDAQGWGRYISKYLRRRGSYEAMFVYSGPRRIEAP